MKTPKNFLTAADKRWLRAMTEQVIQKLLKDMVNGMQQAGGYDGATHVPEECEESESRRGHIGFAVPTRVDAIDTH